MSYSCRFCRFKDVYMIQYDKDLYIKTNDVDKIFCFDFYWKTRF